MKKTRLLLVLVFLLSSVSAVFYPVSASAMAEKTIEDGEMIRPEDYLLTLENMPQTIRDKYATYDFRNREFSLAKFPNYYKAESTLYWGENMRFITRIMVGNQDYLSEYSLRGMDAFDLVSDLQGVGNEALLMTSTFCSEVHFIRGNYVVEVSVMGGGDGSDVQLIAEMIDQMLPDEFPSAETLEIQVPAPAVSISFPGKYIYQLYKNGEQNIFLSSAPDVDHLFMVSRYPFTSFDMAIWSVEQKTYLKRTTVTLTIYEFIVLSAEHNPRIHSIEPGDYEMHYWVNDEFAANYPFEIR